MEKKIIERTIKDSILLLTGMSVYELSNSERYELRLGVIDPISVGFNKGGQNPDIDEMRYSVLVKMLESVCQIMKDPNFFMEWVEKNLLSFNNH